jgi:hypothetical protein
MNGAGLRLSRPSLVTTGPVISRVVGENSPTSPGAATRLPTASGLAPLGNGWREAWLRSRAAAGEEGHHSRDHIVPVFRLPNGHRQPDGAVRPGKI